MQIRPWTSADTPSLRAMYRETWTATYGPTLGADVLQSLLSTLDPPDLSSILPGEDGRTTVAEAGPPHTQEIIGSIIVAERSRTAYLWAMYVSPYHQRQGIGRALLRVGTDGLSSADTLEVRMIGSSLGAFAFYQSFGFQETARDDTELAPGLVLSTVVMTVRRPALIGRLSGS
jgi:ribosomal protein S18 acetylase RimI-like enzyme